MRISTKHISYQEKWKRYIVEAHIKDGKKTYGRCKNIEDAMKCRDEVFGCMEPMEILKKKNGRYIVEKLNKYLVERDGKYIVVKNGKSFGTFTLKEARKQRNKLFGRQFKDFGSTNFKPYTIRKHNHSVGYAYHNKLVADLFRGWDYETVL